MKSAGARRHLVHLAGEPITRTPETDGGYTESLTPLTPDQAFASIEPATAHNMERLFANTVIASATHLVTLPYQADITMKTRLTFGTRTLSVVGMQNPAERNIEWVLACAEVLS